MHRRGDADRRRDIKNRTKVNYTVFDEDVGSRYEYDDDDTAVPVRANILSRGGGAKGAQTRRDNQILRAQVTGTSTRREIINLVTIRNCARSGLEYILNQVAETVEHFRPIAPKINQGHVEFFLANSDDADAVRSMSRRILDRKSGTKLTIVSSRMAAPWEPLKPPVKIMIENVVKSRYSSASNSLDLGDFVNDKEFVNSNTHCPLFKNEVVVHVCNVIARFFPNIQGLSLKGNRLRALDFIATMVYMAPSVTELDLSSNALSRIEELDRIRGWRIEKLHLENNECVLKFTADAYASVIQNYFPRVTYLDGVFVTQDPFKLNALENDGFILPYKLGYTPDTNVREHVERFVLEYLSLYDGPDGEQTRKSLMNAYDDGATMTFAVHRLKDSFTKNFGFVPKGDEEAFSNYIRSSHNIIHQSKWANYRDKIVYKGAMDIAVALSKLPLTNHLKESFILDFNYASSGLVVFTLQGILRDGSDAFRVDGDCKFFIRNFVVVPKEADKMAIVSDMFSLTPISVERMERYINLMKKGATNELKDQQPSTSSMSRPQNAVLAPPPTPQPSQSMDNQTAGSTNGLTTQHAYDVNSPVIRQAMIQQFSEISKMKPEWAEKCLADCQWDFTAAGNAFNLMFGQNQIPQEAFQ